MVYTIKLKNDENISDTTWVNSGGLNLLKQHSINPKLLDGMKGKQASILINQVLVDELDNKYIDGVYKIARICAQFPEGRIIIDEHE